jgi:uncharacterized coiled-coil DUF342 family protein
MNMPSTQSNVFQIKENIQAINEKVDELRQNRTEVNEKKVKLLVELKDFDMKGLKQYLTDYLEFTIYSKLVSQEIKSAFGN